jgi:hypothetical protein
MYYYGKNVREDDLAKALGSDPETGTSIANIERLFTQQGFQVRTGPMTVVDLRKNIDDGIPTMIPIQAWPEIPGANLSNSWDDGHWVVAIGYAPGTIIFDDPVLLDNHGYMAVDVLESRWHDMAEGKKLEHWGIAVGGKEPAYKDRNMIRIDASTRKVATRWHVQRSLRSTNG